MKPVLSFSGRIMRGRSNSRFVEIMVQCGIVAHVFELRRDDRTGLRALANLLTYFPDRDRVFGYETHGLDVRGERWLELDGEPGDLAWLEPNHEGARELPEPGPNELNRASLVFFGKEYRRELPVARTRPVGWAVAPGDVCERCGEPAVDAHHVEPAVWGGATDAANRAKLCERCHKAEHARAIVIRPGWRSVEVLAVQPHELFSSLVQIQITAGDPIGRKYSALWHNELGYQPEIGRVYNVFIGSSRTLEIMSAEPVGRGVATGREL